MIFCVLVSCELGFDAGFSSVVELVVSVSRICLGRSLSVIMQSVKMLYPFLIEMLGLMLFIPFCTLATGGESDRDLQLFFSMVILRCFSVTFFLSHRLWDVLSVGTQSNFAVACLLFVAVSVDKFSSSSVGVLILTSSLCLIYYFADTCSLIAIMNWKSCSTFSLGSSLVSPTPNIYES